MESKFFSPIAQNCYVGSQLSILFVSLSFSSLVFKNIHHLRMGRQFGCCIKAGTLLKCT